MKAVLFDLDGVITSERIYWNCSGLALAKYKGREIPEDMGEKLKLAKSEMPDASIKRFKERGINSNWDITYASSVLSETEKSIGEFLDEMENRNLKGMDYLKLLDEIDASKKHDREKGPWQKAHMDFQACYYELEDTDEPIMPLDKIKGALDEIKSMGLELGIVTGRPRGETEKPLKAWGLWDYFEEHIIITEKEVEEESKRQGKHLGKPDPWPILQAIFQHKKCEKCELDTIKDDYVFVGDSVSDVVAAKNAGIPVICVNTGIASAESLRTAGADLIVEDITGVPTALKKFN